MSARFAWVPRRCTAMLFAALLIPPLGAAAQTHADTTASSAWQTPVAENGAEYARLQKEAQAVTITRDDWGIPHVHGKTDADAVFGRSEEHTSELQSPVHLVCRLLLDKK